MNNRFMRDMTKGSILGHLLIFTVPMLIGNLFQQLYNMVDSIIVGKYVGENALGAVGATSSLNFLFFSLCNGLAIGIGVLASQYYGANDEKKVKKVIANAIYVVTLCGAAMSILGLALARPLLTLLRTPDAILDDSVAYMQIVCAGTLAISLYNIGASLLRALGDSSTPLFFLLLSCVVNIALDLLFVVVFDMAVKGVAYATVAAQIISAVSCLAYAFRKNPYFKLDGDSRRIDIDMCKKCMRVGLPIAAQSALISVSCIIVQVYVNGFGELAVAAFTAVSRIEQLLHQPFQSLSSAISTFAGQNIGASRMDRVKRSYAVSTVLYISVALAMMLTCQTFGEQLINIFVNKAEVIDMGARALRITSKMYVMLGCIYITRGFLNGVGDTMASLVNGIVEIGSRVIFSVLFTYCFLSSGVYGAWYVQGLTWFVAGAALLIRFFRGKWKNRSLVTEVSPQPKKKCRCA